MVKTKQCDGLIGLSHCFFSAFKQLLYVIFTLFIERSYISNKKARLEYYEFRIVKIEDTYIAVEELQTDISFRSEFR